MINGAAATNAAFQTVPLGSQAAAVELTLNAGLMTALSTFWATAFPVATNPFPTGQYSSAFLLAPAILSPNMDLSCAVDQINLLITSNGINAPASLAPNIANTILSNLINDGGIVATSAGHKILGPVQQIAWACITLAGVVSPTGGSEQHLIGYGFAIVNL